MSEAGEGSAPIGRSGGDPLDAPADNPACLFCGEPERFEIVEIWGHEFIFETCCEPLIWTVKLGFRLTRHLPSSSMVSNGGERSFRF